MRVIKLSKLVFEDQNLLRDYFTNKLPELNPPGLFTFINGIGEDGLYVGETLIFSYDGRIRYIANAASGRELNRYQNPGQNERYCFQIDLASIKEVDIKMSEVEKRLKKEAGLQKSLVGQGWTIVEETKATKRVVESLAMVLKQVSDQPLSKSLRPEDAFESHSGDWGAYKPSEDDQRKLIERQIRERRGQSSFRNSMCKKYNQRCIVTDCSILAILEAAHIQPYRGENDNNHLNGLLLRADIHTLFDLDLLGINPNSRRVEVHPSIRAEYGMTAGKILKLPKRKWPSVDALRNRYAKFRDRLKKD
jgi:hypothetical protein